MGFMNWTEIRCFAAVAAGVVFFVQEFIYAVLSTSFGLPSVGWWAFVFS